MKNLFTYFKKQSCKHRFDYDDMIGRLTPDGDVTWPCWKCGKVFKEYCGLEILRYGEVQKKQ